MDLYVTLSGTVPGVRWRPGDESGASAEESGRVPAAELARAAGCLEYHIEPQKTGQSINISLSIMSRRLEQVIASKLLEFR